MPGFYTRSSTKLLIVLPDSTCEVDVLVNSTRLVLFLENAIPEQRFEGQIKQNESHQ